MANKPCVIKEDRMLLVWLKNLPKTKDPSGYLTSKEFEELGATFNGASYKRISCGAMVLAYEHDLLDPTAPALPVLSDDFQKHVERVTLRATFFRGFRPDGSYDQDSCSLVAQLLYVQGCPAQQVSIAGPSIRKVGDAYWDFRAGKFQPSVVFGDEPITIGCACKR